MEQEKIESNNSKEKGNFMSISNKTIRIWEKNLKQGYRFFQPHNAIQRTPRTLKEAFGYRAYSMIQTADNSKDNLTYYLVVAGISLVVLGVLLFK